MHRCGFQVILGGKVGTSLVRPSNRAVAGGIVHGRQLGIAEANGGYSYVALCYRNNRLYQVEGNAFVAGGQAEVEAMRFQQSLDLT
jgi:hypothetical protein